MARASASDPTDGAGFAFALAAAVGFGLATAGLGAVRHVILLPLRSCAPTTAGMAGAATRHDGEATGMGRT